ncbi:MAG: hypothetical protein ABI783_06360, partial [Actinomycetota bacterium]
PRARHDSALASLGVMETVSETPHPRGGRPRRFPEEVMAEVQRVNPELGERGQMNAAYAVTAFLVLQHSLSAHPELAQARSYEAGA